MPKNHELLHAFLGLASYFKKFIKNFAEIAAPLHVLTEITKSWQWTSQCDAFFSLNEKLLLLVIIDTDAISVNNMKNMNESLLMQAGC